jgi:hypothetical protein
MASNSSDLTHQGELPGLNSHRSFLVPLSLWPQSPAASPPKHKPLSALVSQCRRSRSWTRPSSR